MANRIIVPATYTFEVIIKVDPNNGQSELYVRNRSKANISMWQVAGLLAEHTSNLMSQLLKGTAKQTTVEVIEAENAGDNNAT